MWRWELLGGVRGLVIDHQLPAVILWPLLFVAMMILLDMFSLSCCCECVLYQIRRSVSSVPACVDVVRSSFEGDNPLLDLFPPLIPLVHLVIEGETGVPVVHLFTAETLVSRYE